MKEEEEEEEKEEEEEAASSAFPHAPRQAVETSGLRYNQEFLLIRLKEL
jgi:hypothetical protein